jgi:hypothetical protein
MIINELPVNHELRNKPLSGGWYRWKNGKVWKEIKPTFKIANFSFNDLGVAWVENDIFTFENPADHNKG